MVMESNDEFLKIISDVQIYISSLQEKQHHSRRTSYYYAGLMSVSKVENPQSYKYTLSYEFECFRQCRFKSEQNRDLWVDNINTIYLQKYNELKAEWDRKVSQRKNIFKKCLDLFSGISAPNIYVWVALSPSVAKSFRDRYRKKGWIPFRYPNTQPEDYPNHDLYIIYYRKDFYRDDSHLKYF